MTLEKKMLLGVAVLAIAAGIYGYKEYNRKNKDLAYVKPDIKINVAELIAAFEKNEAESNKIYLDKVIEIDGPVKQIIKDEKGYYTAVLGQKENMSSVRCSMDTVHQKTVSVVAEGSQVSIKGVCTGFNADELLGSDVILNRCVIVTKK